MARLHLSHYCIFSVSDRYVSRPGHHDHGGSRADRHGGRLCRLR
jgi:hypothetical protein